MIGKHQERLVAEQRLVAVLLTRTGDEYRGWEWPVAALIRLGNGQRAGEDEAFRVLDDNLALAEAQSDDPLNQVLAFVKLFEDAAKQLTEPYPGCLFGSYCYEAGLFVERTMRIIQETMLTWRRRFGAPIAEVIERHPPRRAVDADSLADMMTVIFEGAFIVSKTLREPKVVAAQAAHFRTYLELLFAPAPTG